MLRVDQQAIGVSATDELKRSLKAIAVHFGRPSSDHVLFSGVPFPEDAADPDLIRTIARRVQLEAEDAAPRTAAEFATALPLLVIGAGGSFAVILRTLPGNLAEVKRPSGEVEQAPMRELADRRRYRLVSFSKRTLPAEGEPGAERPRQGHWFFSTILRQWRSYLHVVAASFIINIIAIATPLFIMNVYDRVLPNKASATLVALAVGVFVALLFDLLLKSARAALIDFSGRQADLSLSTTIYDKVLNTSLNNRAMSAGEHTSRVMQYEFIRDFFTSNTVALAVDTFFVLIFIFIIFLIGGWLFLIPTAAFVLAGVIGLVAQKMISTHIQAAQAESARRQGILVETISTLETVKALRAEAHMLREWQETCKNSARTQEKIKRYSALAANATQFVQQLVAVAIVLAGSFMFAAGEISVGAIIASVMLANRTVAPLSQLALLIARYRQAALALRMLDGIMELEEDRPATANFVSRDIASGNFAFEKVRFRYPHAETDALNGLTLKVAEGERVGILGRVGSGKTTIGRLLSGLYFPQEGEVLIDGIDTRQFHPQEIRGAVGTVSQAVDLFAGSVRQNLLMAKPDATDGELVRAARLSGLEQIVSRHPRGFDMMVGEKGANLSGGQRQMIALARLLLTKPRIVFLDEPSGSMDLGSERVLIESLRTAFDPSVTVVVATHRHSMLEIVDRLVVVNEGRIVADGPKEKVLAMMRQEPK